MNVARWVEPIATSSRTTRARRAAGDDDVVEGDDSVTGARSGRPGRIRASSTIRSSIA